LHSQAAKARPREVRLTADDIQKLRAVVAEASGGDADVAKPVQYSLFCALIIDNLS
jgi:hypothetical protein